MDKKFIDLKRFIFTGTPGSGKTSVIKELEKLGHIVIYEAATDVISIEQAKNIERPWESLKFVDKITYMQKERQIRHCQRSEAIQKDSGSVRDELQFYDRAPFCTYALGKYLSHWKNVEFTPSFVLLDEIDRCLKNNVYQNEVFFFENLSFIEHTAARQISYEDALIFEQIHLDVYNQFGFEIIMVSKELTVTQRCAFILERVL